ncbi:MAG: sugar transferase [Bryobacterales bacterium]|nr:sugar transferase [Bryobacterales bacterium]
MAILVVTHQSHAHLPDLWSSLRAQTHRNWELIAVDSASTDGTRRWLESHCPEARLVASPQNLGYRKGNRLGMEQASAGGDAPDYLLILNDDVELHPYAIERMVAAAEDAPDVAIVAPAILVHGHASRINAAGSALLPAGFYSARGKNRNYEEYREPAKIAAASGCCFLFRMEDYRKLGGFDAIFDSLPGGWHASAEDLDLCWKVWVAGKRVVYQPEAILWHKYQQRPMHASRFASLVAGRLAYLALNFRKRDLLCLAPVLALTEVALGAYSALRGAGFLRAWMNGYRWLWGNCRRLRELRGLRSARRPSADRPLAHLMQPAIPLAPSVESNLALRAAAMAWFAINALCLGALRLSESLSGGGAWKRAKPLLDGLAAAALLLLLSPLLAGVAVAVGWKIGWPVLFKQTRIGWKEHPFVLYKFRTMRDGVDSSGRALPDEQRLTPLGRWLRAWSIDELPQLWNVLKGEMSFIGPRPLLPEYLPRYSDRQRRRHAVRPGLSGWAQVCGRNAIDWERRFALDVEYVERQSLRFDLRILYLTLKKLLTQEGISQPGHATMEEFRGAESHG